jgi:hypothetical protein
MKRYINSKNRKKDRTFAAIKDDGPDNHMVFIYAPGHSISD